MSREGWECPKCGYCYSPAMPCCTNCNRPEHEKTQTSTGNDFKIWLESNRDFLDNNKDKK